MRSNPVPRAFGLVGALLLLAAFLIVTASAGEKPTSPQSFATAKTKLLQLYRDHGQDQTFYCGCGFNADKKVDASECGYEVRSNEERGGRIEWEHLVPAAAFGRYRQCWREKLCEKSDGTKFKGRKCCGKVDLEFKHAEGDMHNLVPAVGELNGDRSNFPFRLLPGEPREYGACDFEVDKTRKLVEPAPGVRGDIGRAYLYISDTYGMPLSPEERVMHEQWSADDPSDAWEQQRNSLIEQIQGNRNPHIN